MNMTDKPLRAVIWAAVSTKAQVEEGKESIPLQIEAGQKLVEKEGWNLIATLIVPGHSRRYIRFEDLKRDMRKAGYDAADRIEELWQAKGFDVLIVRDGDRFARTQSLHSLFVETTIFEVGARIYSFADGWIDKKKARIFAAFSGYNASKNVDDLVEKRQQTMGGVVARGLPASNAPAMSHKVLYDPETRKAIKMVLDETKAALWDHLYMLVVEERIGWPRIEYELYKRYGDINPNTGYRFARGTMYNTVYSPHFWGHTGRYYGKVSIGKSWVYTESETPPEGVEIYRNTIQPVYAGERAMRFKAELRRREATVRGKTRTRTGYAFTGLLMCYRCRALMYSRPTSRARDRYVYWRCDGKTSYFSLVKCDQPNPTDQGIRDQVNKILEETVKRGDLTRIHPANEQHDERESLRKRIDALNEQIDDDFNSQRASRVESVKDRYRQLIDDAAEQVEILNRRMRELDELAADPDLDIAQQALTTLQGVGLDKFWKWEPGAQNQLLHALLGKRRWLVEDRKIVGTAPYQKRFSGRKPKKKAP